MTAPHLTTILTIDPRGRLCYPHYTDGKTEAQSPKSLTLSPEPVKITGRTESRSQSPKPQSPRQREAAESSVSLIHKYIFFSL